MKINLILVAVLLTLPVLIGAAPQKKEPLRVVPAIDFNRYAGKWYEIARFPNRFQKRCAGEVTAEYTLRTDGKITVLNRCRLADGSSIQAKGLAKTAGKGRPNSVLKVRFAPAFLSFIPQVLGRLSGACPFAGLFVGGCRRSSPRVSVGSFAHSVAGRCGICQGRG